VKQLLFITIFVLLTFTGLAISEANSKDIQRKLTLIRAQISETEKEVTTHTAALKSKAKVVRDIESEVAKLDKGQKEGEQRVVKISKELESISLQIEDGKFQLNIKRSNFLSRLRGMYKSRRGLPALSFIFNSEDVHALYRRASYMQKLIEEDHNQLSEYEGLLKTLAETELARQSFFKEEKVVLDRVKILKADEVKKNLEVAKATRELNDQIDNRKFLIVSLKKEEDEFESILQGLMGGSSDTENPILENKTEPIEEKSVIAKKSIFYPVPGTVLQHFGKQKHSDYKEVINVKGIEMSVSSGSLVRVIAQGAVVFSSTLPGFGNVVIVEHPAKYYSLYGRIKEPVPIGKALEKGDSIGVTTEKDEKGRNFYFELRKNGVPLNPEEYLRRG